jgi:uncharacterized protein YbbC (DUF1343 family)
MKIKNFIFFYLFLTAFSSVKGKDHTQIFPGIVQTDLYLPLLKDKSVGVVANQTSVIGRYHLVDSLKGSGVNIKCVFAPEHGFRGEKSAGEKVLNSIDKKTGLKIISLYGKNVAPKESDLNGIDIILFDIQDVGVRFYTYISTLQYIMEACSDKNIQLIILDRPNPHSFYIDGPVLKPEFSSFVGMQSVPVVYAMTIGEYAMMLNGEGWLKGKKKCNLKVIPIKNYTHNSKYQLRIPPSPNLPDMDAVYLYPSICFFEGTHVSLGRGTDKPFRLIGFQNNKKDTVSFTPKEIPGIAVNPPYEDTLCKGIDLSREGKKVILNKSLKLKWLLEMYAAFPDKEKFFNNFFDKLAGTDQLRLQITQNKTEKEIRNSWKGDIDKFKIIRKKYLLYEDFE